MSKLTIYRHPFRPLRDHILVKMDELEKVSKGGIILPSTITKESNFKGTIESVSKYDEQNETPYGIGRKVIVSKGSGMSVSFDDNFGGEYRLFNKEEVRYVF